MSIKELTIIETYKKIIENIFGWELSEYTKGQHDLCCKLIEEIEKQNNEEIENIKDNTVMSKSVQRRLAIMRGNK